MGGDPGVNPKGLTLPRPWAGYVFVALSFSGLTQEIMLILLPPPAGIAHIVAMLLQEYRAIYDPPSLPPDPPCVCHTPYNTGSCNIV